MSIKKRSDEALCQVIWDYLGPQQPLKPADAIIAGGSCDLHVPEEAARLFRLCTAQWLVVSGGWHGALEDNEAEAYAAVAMDHGVPYQAIIKDHQARNTGHNITHSQQRLLGKGVIPHAVVLVHTPIMSRRFLATAEAQWQGEPQPHFITRHEEVDFATYIQRPNMGDTIPRMIGYVARMQPHAEQGFQTPQFVPAEVQEACDVLLSRGYTSRGLHH